MTLNIKKEEPIKIACGLSVNKLKNLLNNKYPFSICERDKSTDEQVAIKVFT